MNLNKIFKSKKQKIVYLILFSVMLIAFVYLGTVNFKELETDAEKFSNEFSSVSEDNVFVYSTASEVLDYIENGDAIILFGSNLNDFTENYAYIINEIAKEGIKQEDSEFYISKILYYDFIEDRTNNNGNYELIVEQLNSYLLTDDLGNTEIYAPTLVIIKDGEVLYINEDINFVSGNITPDEYWTDLTTGIFEETLRTVFKDFIGVS